MLLWSKSWLSGPIEGCKPNLRLPSCIPWSVLRARQRTGWPTGIGYQPTSPIPWPTSMYCLHIQVHFLLSYFLSASKCNLYMLIFAIFHLIMEHQNPTVYLIISLNITTTPPLSDLLCGLKAIPHQKCSQWQQKQNFSGRLWWKITKGVCHSESGRALTVLSPSLCIFTSK